MNKNDLHAGYLEINKGPLCFRKTRSTRTLVYSGVESITVICHPPEQNKAMLSRESDNVYKRPSSALCKFVPGKICASHTLYTQSETKLTRR